MNEIIEKLKDNKVGWMFLSNEEKKCIKQANAKGMIENLLFGGDWENNKDGFNLTKVGANEIFRIKPDYHPKPEYVDCEIVVGSKLYFERLIFYYASYTYRIEEALSLPNFDCFRMDNTQVRIEHIAGYIYVGNKVYVRFRKSATD